VFFWRLIEISFDFASISENFIEMQQSNDLLIWIRFLLIINVKSLIISCWFCEIVKKYFEFKVNIFGWLHENISHFERWVLLSRYSEINFNELTF
jgi:hypothetical protein